MNLRGKLTYPNVVATLALILAVGGGTVYAANKLKKNSVKSKQIAKGAVKSSELATGAVSSKKVKDGSIEAGDLAAGIFEGIDVDVTGSASAGTKTGVNTNATEPLPLSGDTSFTPGAGEVAAIAAEGRFSIATANVAEFCRPAVFLLINGQPTRVFVAPDADGDNTTLETSLGRDADGPFGVFSPGTPLTITAQIRGDEHCTADSQLDGLEIRILQIR